MIYFSSFLPSAAFGHLAGGFLHLGGRLLGAFLGRGGGILGGFLGRLGDVLDGLGGVGVGIGVLGHLIGNALTGGFNLVAQLVALLVDRRGDVAGGSWMVAATSAPRAAASEAISWPRAVTLFTTSAPLVAASW